MPSKASLKRLVDEVSLPMLMDPENELRVFSHRSLFALPAHEQNPDVEPQDWERLAFLGDQLLGMCTTDIILERYPNARPSFLTKRKNEVVNNGQVAKWSEAYGLPQRIRAHQSQAHLLRASVSARASVFEAYAGAVYYDAGMEAVIRWLRPWINLVLDEEDEKDRKDMNQMNQPYGTSLEDSYEPESYQHAIPDDDVDVIQVMNLTLQDNPRPAIRGQTPRTTSISSTPFTESPLLATPKPVDNPLYSQPKPPQFSPPQLYHPEKPFGPGTPDSRGPISSQAAGLGFHPHGTISSPGSSSPYTGSVYQTPDSKSSGSSGPSNLGSPTPTPIVPQSTAQTSGYLALFNQFAAQRHVVPVWTTESAGPPHRPIFTAKVTVSDHQGIGKAYNKQSAKHLAAKDALKKLKWLES
ncbi:ribonuclease III [Serendipita vermifera]|nr:ribonuclease III [Serendipita vermifera]